MDYTGRLAVAPTAVSRSRGLNSLQTFMAHYTLCIRLLSRHRGRSDVLQLVIIPHQDLVRKECVLSHEQLVFILPTRREGYAELTWVID